MKHYLDLVPISAKVHRKQNKTSISCIILAVFLVTAIFGMADMFIRSQIMQAKIDGGDYHIAVKDITDEEAALISKRPDVKAAARYGVLNFKGDRGYTISDKKTIIVGSDEEYAAELQVGLIGSEGRFPHNDSEAMITRNAKENLGLRIGDTITVKRPGDTELSYQISGFCNDAPKTMSEDAYGIFVTVSAFRGIDNIGNSTAFADCNMVLCIQFAKTYNIQNAISGLKADCRLSDEQILENTKLLGLLGQSSNSFMMQVYISAFILFLLVLSAGIMMIAGSLNSNVVQRTEFFGLMRCIGATPKQVMKLVRKEAFRWCRFAIPAGVAAGIVVIWFLCAVLQVLSPKYFGAMPLFGISVPSIAAGIIIGLLTVLLASRSPAKKAAKVSPLAAVSGNASGLQPVRKAADTRWFKVETALGVHHAKAGKKNYTLTVLSFSFSVILFLAFSVTIVFMNHSLTPLRPWTADISMISPDNTCSIDSAILEQLKETSIVDCAYGRMFSYDVPFTVNGIDKMTDIISYEQKQFGWAEKYLLDGSIQTVSEEANSGLIVYEPQSIIKTGDTVRLDIRGKETEIKIVGMLSDCPFDNGADTEMVICSENTFRTITGQSDYTIIDIQLRKNATDTDVNAIRQMAGNHFIFSDERMGNESARGAYYCMRLFLYGFLAVIAVITILNIINNIALSVMARMKQYGAFRAIGLSVKTAAGWPNCYEGIDF